MLLKRNGLPEEGEILLCEVTNIHYHSVFVKILEYGIDGMIHISEISPGRIRNIRDYVKEGKYIVCKVIRVNHEKRHVDLSLRRVNERERIQKNSQIKQEQRAEKLVIDAAKELGMNEKELYSEITSELFKDYDWLHEAFLDYVEGKLDLNKYNLDKKILDVLAGMIKKHIKPPLAVINGEFLIKTYKSNGAVLIRDAFKELYENVSGNYKIKYEGGGKYNFEITGKDYKICESILKQMNELLAKKFTSRELSVIRKDAKSSSS